MNVNPEKFQIKNSYALKINNTDIVATSSVTLLGVKLDKNLNFNNHISTICQKACDKLNARSQIPK